MLMRITYHFERETPDREDGIIEANVYRTLQETLNMLSLFPHDENLTERQRKALSRLFEGATMGDVAVICDLVNDVVRRRYEAHGRSLHPYCVSVLEQTKRCKLDFDRCIAELKVLMLDARQA